MIDLAVVFVNVFVLPLISLYIYMKRQDKQLLFTFENVCIYSIFLAVGLVFNKGISIVIRIFFAKNIDLNFTVYTMVGIVIFALLPIVFEIVKKYFSVKLEVKKNEKE